MLSRQQAQNTRDNTPASPAKQKTKTEAQPAMEQQPHPATIVQRIKADPRVVSRREVKHLQRTIGNQAVGKLIRGVYKNPIQTKLTINQAGDKYEQEADRVADQVMRIPEPVNPVNTTSPIQRQEEEEQESLQAKPLAQQITPLVQRQVDEEEAVQKQAEAEEEDLAQTMLLQREVEEEEEVAQIKPLTIQRLCPECEKERTKKEGSIQRAIYTTPPTTIRACALNAGKNGKAN
jgi:hypothetical protein